MRRNRLTGFGMTRKPTGKCRMQDRAPGRYEQCRRRLVFPGYHDAAEHALPQPFKAPAAMGEGLEHDAGFQELATNLPKLHFVQRLGVAGIECRPRGADKVKGHGTRCLDLCRERRML